AQTQVFFESFCSIGIRTNNQPFLATIVLQPITEPDYTWVFQPPILDRNFFPVVFRAQLACKRQIPYGLQVFLSQLHSMLMQSSLGKARHRAACVAQQHPSGTMAVKQITYS